MSNHGPQKRNKSKLKEIVCDLIEIAKDFDTDNRNYKMDNFVIKNKNFVINSFEKIVKSIEVYCSQTRIQYKEIYDEVAEYEAKGDEILFKEKLKISEEVYLVGFEKTNIWHLLLTKILPLQNVNKSLSNTRRKDIISNLLVDLLPSTFYLIGRISTGKLLSCEYYTCYNIILEKCNWIGEYGLSAQDDFISLFTYAKPQEKNNYAGNIQLLLVTYRQALSFLSCFCAQPYSLVLDHALKFSKKLRDLAPEINKLNNCHFTSKEIEAFSNLFNRVAASEVIRPMWVYIFDLVNHFYINDWLKYTDYQDIDFKAFHEATLSLIKQMSGVNPEAVGQELTIEGIEHILVSNVLSVLKTYKSIPASVPNPTLKEATNDVLKVMYTIYPYVNFPVHSDQKCIIYSTQAIFKRIIYDLVKKQLALNEAKTKYEDPNVTEPTIDKVSETNLSAQDLGESALLISDDGIFTDQKPVTEEATINFEINIVLDQFMALKIIKEETEEYSNAPTIQETSTIQEESPTEILENPDINTELKTEIEELTHQNEIEVNQLKRALEISATEYRKKKQEEFEGKKRKLNQEHTKAKASCQEAHKKNMGVYNKEYKAWCTKLSQEEKKNKNELDALIKSNEDTEEKKCKQIQKKKEAYSQECLKHKKKCDEEQNRHNAKNKELNLLYQQICNEIKQYPQQSTAQLNDQIKRNQKEEADLQQKLNIENEKLNAMKKRCEARSQALKKKQAITLQNIKYQTEQASVACLKLQKNYISYSSIAGLTPIATIQVSEDVVYILEKLKANQIEYLIFGGFVRDRLLKLPKYIIDTNDIDVLVNCRPEDLPLEIRNNSRPCVKEDLVRLGRIDLVCKRWANVENLKKELLKLDVTINAFVCSHNDVDNVYDVYDVLEVEADLNLPYLVTIGEASNRFKEDPTIILRLIRMAIKLNKQIDPQDYQAIQKLSFLIPQRLSMGLYINNLKKLFAHHGATQYYEEINKLGMLCHIIPTIPLNYKWYVQPSSKLNQFWKKKMRDMANASEDISGYYVLALFLLMPLLHSEQINKNLDVRVEAVIDAFLEKTTGFNNADKELLRRSVTAFMIGNRDMLGIYTQYKNFESTSTTPQNNQSRSGSFTPSYHSIKDTHFTTQQREKREKRYHFEQKPT